MHEQATRTYNQHIQERKHMAFMKWKASGYRDIKAHEAFIFWWSKGVEFASRYRAAGQQNLLR